VGGEKNNDAQPDAQGSSLCQWEDRCSLLTREAAGLRHGTCCHPGSAACTELGVSTQERVINRVRDRDFGGSMVPPELQSRLSLCVFLSAV
jgi:hypothetical protein